MHAIVRMPAEFLASARACSGDASGREFRVSDQRSSLILVASSTRDLRRAAHHLFTLANEWDAESIGDAS
jgi:hypothetical protein